MSQLSKLVTTYEKKHNIPNKLLWSIAKIESGANQFALNIEGRPYNLGSRKEAMEILKSHLDKGIRNIDIGLMQINFHYHGEKFACISEMLDTENNIAYAASFLKGLYKKHGSWQEAVRHYHSTKPEYYRKYSRKVLLSWLKA